jgi:hypothetical protein
MRLEFGNRNRPKPSQREFDPLRGPESVVAARITAISAEGHSARSAVIGSTDAARRAGNHADTITTVKTIAAVAT